MKKFLILIQIIVMLGCSKGPSDVEMYPTQGIPDVNQAFSYMYFKNEKEGYLFGTYTTYEQVTPQKLDNPNFTPQSTEEANIYKTMDGGKNWIKINALVNYRYSDVATNLNNEVYISKSDEREYFKFKIVRFSIIDKTVKDIKNTEPVSAIWNNRNKIFFTTSRNNIKLYSIENGQMIDSINIRDYALFGLNMKDKSYAIFTNKEATYFGSIGNGIREIKLPIIPEVLTKKDENNILIADNATTDENAIFLINYNVNSAQSSVLKEFKGYSIIENLQSNDKVIAGFIGNIVGLFTAYDLFYSLDQGKTWKIQKLKEESYVRPSCLVGNIMYIYSGGARMQKIVLK